MIMWTVKQADARLRAAVRTFAIVGGGLFILLAIAVSQFISIARVDEVDPYLFAQYGRQLLDGATLYVDVWDNKPPGIFWVNALGLWLTDGSLSGVRVIQSMVVTWTAMLFFVIAWRMYGAWIALACTVLAVLFLNIHNYHVGANRPSTYFIFTELLCFYFYVRAADGDRCGFVTCVLAGACGAIGFAFKQSALAVVCAAMLHSIYLPLCREITWRVAISRIAAIAAGWLTVTLLVVAALWMTSDLPAAWDAVVGFNRRYFLPGAGSSPIPPFVWIEEHLRNMGLALVLAVATLLSPLVVFAVRPRKHPNRIIVAPSCHSVPRRYIFLLWVWLLIAIYLAALGPHMRVAYLAIALPPLVLAMAHSVHLLVASARVSGHVPPHYVLVGILWFAYMLIWPIHGQWDMAMRQYYHRHVADPDPIIESQLTAINEHTSDGDAIFAFGYAPEIYWRSGRSSSIKYIGTEKIAQLGPHGQPLLDETLDLLEASPPKLILLDGSTAQASASLGRLDTTRLAEWLQRNYQELNEQRYPNVWVSRSTP